MEKANSRVAASREFAIPAPNRQLLEFAFGERGLCRSGAGGQRPRPVTPQNVVDLGV